MRSGERRSWPSSCSTKARPLRPEEITNYCRGKIAGYKVPKNVVFIKDEEMPRTGNGKILHRVLREKYGMWKDHQ